MTLTIKMSFASNESFDTLPLYHAVVGIVDFRCFTWIAVFTAVTLLMRFRYHAQHSLHPNTFLVCIRHGVALTISGFISVCGSDSGVLVYCFRDRECKRQ